MFLIALLAAIVMPRFIPVDRHMRLSRALMDVDMLQQALDRYRSDHGDYPASDEGLTALIGPQKQYFERTLIDPWGRQYVYRHQDGAAYQLYSLGVNGIDENGGGDDVMAGSDTKHYRCSEYDINCPIDQVIGVALVGMLILGACGLLVFLSFGALALYGRNLGART